MLCQDIMRRPVERALIGETVTTAAQTMRDANIGFLPVCDSNGHVVGVLTDRDIVIRMCATGGSPDDVAVETVMTNGAVSCDAHDELSDAEQLMASTRKSRIVVIGTDGSPAGVISLSDVVAQSAQEGADTLRQVAAREVLDEGGHTKRR